MEGAYQVSVGGVEQGPLSASEIRDRLARGELDRLDTCWRDGWQEWRPLSVAFPEQEAEASTPWWSYATAVCAAVAVGLAPFSCYHSELLSCAALGAMVCGGCALWEYRRSGGRVRGIRWAAYGLVIALGAWGATPRFSAVRRFSWEKSMQNDARQIAAAVSQYCDGTPAGSVDLVYDPATGVVGSPLHDYFPSLMRGYTLVPQRLAKGGTFQLGHPKVGVMTFDADGRVVKKEPKKQ